MRDHAVTVLLFAALACAHLARVVWWFSAPLAAVCLRASERIAARALRLALVEGDAP